MECILTALAAAGAIYHAIAAVLLRRWIAGKKGGRFPPRPPVTFFRPIKSGVRDLRGKLESLIRAGGAADQFIFGADENDALAICEAVRHAHAGRDFVVVRCEPQKIANPKIAKLVQMAPHARHEHWIVSDSEAIFDAAWIENFCAEWIASNAIGMSAPYRFVGAENFPQRLDHAATLLTLLPGLSAARALGKTNFFLGACMAVKKSAIESLGGFAAFGDFLAEDNRLGAALAHRGKVLLGSQLATLDSDAMNWRDYFLHQHRAGVTYRVCDPLGFFAMGITHGTGAALWLAASAPCEGWPWWVLGAVIFFRVLTARANACATDFPAGVFSIALACLAEPFCWLASWLPLPVFWGGKWMRVSSGGRIVETTREAR